METLYYLREALIERRKELGWSQKKMAAACCLPHSRYYRMETGRRLALTDEELSSLSRGTRIPKERLLKLAGYR